MSLAGRGGAGQRGEQRRARPRGRGERRELAPGLGYLGLASAKPHLASRVAGDAAFREWGPQPSGSPRSTAQEIFLQNPHPHAHTGATARVMPAPASRGSSAELLEAGGDSPRCPSPVQLGHPHRREAPTPGGRGGLRDQPPTGRTRRVALRVRASACLSVSESEPGQKKGKGRDGGAASPSREKQPCSDGEKIQARNRGRKKGRGGMGGSSSFPKEVVLQRRGESPGEVQSLPPSSHRDGRAAGFTASGRRACNAGAAGGCTEDRGTRIHILLSQEMWPGVKYSELPAKKNLIFAIPAKETGTALRVPRSKSCSKGTFCPPTALSLTRDKVPVSLFGEFR